MSTVPSWLEDTVAWNTLYFGVNGKAAPGLAKVTARQRNKVQKNAGPGINGGSIVDQGAELSLDLVITQKSANSDDRRFSRTAGSRTIDRNLCAIGSGLLIVETRRNRKCNQGFI